MGSQKLMLFQNPLGLVKPGVHPHIFEHRSCFIQVTRRLVCIAKIRI